MLRPSARAAIEREAIALRRRASQIDVSIEHNRVSVHVELDRLPTTVHLGIKANDAVADIDAFEQEVSRVFRIVLRALTT